MDEELEESSRLSLKDENGVETEFEYLDCIEFNGDEYLILMPVEELETSIVILKVIPVNEEKENYISENDPEILDAVYGIFKEKYKDVLTFEE